MKRIVMASVGLLLVLTLVGCGHNSTKEASSSSSTKAIRVVKIKPKYNGKLSIDGTKLTADYDFGNSAKLNISAKKGSKITIKDTSGQNDAVNDYRVEKTGINHFWIEAKTQNANLNVKVTTKKSYKTASVTVVPDPQYAAKASSAKASSIAFDSSVTAENSSASASQSSQKETTKESKSEANISTAGKKYVDKLNNLNKGTAQYCTFDTKSNTVTWIGYDDWKTYSHDDLQDIMNILQTMSYKYEPKSGVHIIVQTPDGTKIAENSDSNTDLQFVN